ncbi:U7 snRNA-associated Sm-like protein LSm10 [Belonocnema kinseyi]|uniref:U7 snRNA-associated Sm-like protein LSm10 n=1 Tax=Belonocnema kinseyi TaxID=2817044 RepID=UPI00143CCE54|nr:U7 snRNA-associated Sm-like protein LSm10 [Belonocnema kinseyi]
MSFSAHIGSRTSAKEKYNIYNSLAVLIKAIEGQKTTVDLRNESTVTGILEQADGFMNIVMKECLFTDPRGDSFTYEMFFVHARNIRFVHIPPHIPIIPAIQDELRKVSGHPTREKNPKRTLRDKNVQNAQREGLAGVAAVLEERKSKILEETTSESK